MLGEGNQAVSQDTKPDVLLAQLNALKADVDKLWDLISWMQGATDGKDIQAKAPQEHNSASFMDVWNNAPEAIMNERKRILEATDKIRSLIY